jgi:RNA polymerase sigma-70 factor (ECF subfamily)
MCPASSHPTDHEALARLREGDEAALEFLMRTYAPRLGAIAYTLLGRHDLAKDVVQDLFVALWEQRASLDIRQGLSSYLARSVRNRALNAIRHERHQARFSDPETAFDSDTLLAAYNAGEHNVDVADFNAQVLRLLDTIPAQQRRAFLLSWHAGLSYPEIAELMDIAVPSVSQLMYRATQRLAAILPSALRP